MISRRNIRIKVMQTLYTLESRQQEFQLQEADRILDRHFHETRKLFHYLAYFITEVALYAEKDAYQRAQKHLPSDTDLNINTKIAGNSLLWKMLEDPGYVASKEELHPESLRDELLLKKIYKELTSSEDYQEYIREPEREKRSEKDILIHIFSRIMLPSPDFISHVEEHFINWDDDAEMLAILIQNFIQKPAQIHSVNFVSAEKLDFAHSLLKTTAEKKEVSLELLKPKLKNWDAERIASLDLLMIRMAIMEFLFFETIPPKVTINEYIDIAKEYSTEQSGHFINGILDNILKELTTQGRINKKTYKNSTL
jgi:N utilization substance protein B